jgi:DNA-binding CsgD family transcriptional regulator
MKNTHNTKQKKHLNVVSNDETILNDVSHETILNDVSNDETKINLNEFEQFKHFENIKLFIETNKNAFFKLTQIAKILQCDAKTLRQKFRKIYAIFDQSKLPQIVASQNDNEKWLFEFNEKNVLNVLKMSYMQNIKIEMPLLKIA